MDQSIDNGLSSPAFVHFPDTEAKEHPLDDRGWVDGLFHVVVPHTEYSVVVSLVLCHPRDYGHVIALEHSHVEWDDWWASLHYTYVWDLLLLVNVTQVDTG